MTALADVVATVQATVSYLRTAGTGDEDLRRCDGFVADPSAVRRLIDQTAAGRGTGDPQVAASLFVQAYGFRIPSVALGAYALGLPTPSLAPADTAFGMARHRPATVAHLTAALQPDDAAAAARLAGAVVTHLGALIAAVRSTTTVGERLLWGNVTASCVTVFRAIEGAVPPPGRAGVRARAERFLRAEGAWAGLGALAPGSCAFLRTNCCLWYRTTPTGDAPRYCDDCPLRSHP
jgi:hypothetical protein